MIIDSHCHLTYEPMSLSLRETIHRANNDGVKYMLTISTEDKSFEKILKIVEEFKTEFQIRKVNADDKGIVLRGTEHMQKTDISDPQYFHKVVDCQYACPAHTNVPEYIRLIAQKKYDDAYMLNWESNVFPGILGRTCDRPCEPACRRGRTHDK